LSDCDKGLKLVGGYLISRSDRRRIDGHSFQKARPFISREFPSERVENANLGSEDWTNEQCNDEIVQYFQPLSDRLAIPEFSMSSQWYEG
jgi:hypothetical protein